MSSKNDELNPVWVAGYFPKRVKGDIVEHTNIGLSVDKILVDQLPIVTYRILGFLLLGVARIYAKKAEYLLRDCNHSLHEMQVLFEGRRQLTINVGGMCTPESSNKRSKPNAVDVPVSAESSSRTRYSFLETMRAQFTSISLPENFELDAFDLEIVEDDSNDSHVKPHLEIVLKDAWENDRTAHDTFSKDRGDVFARFSDYASDYAITNGSKKFSETRAEKFLHTFSLEEGVDPMVLGEPDNEEDLPSRRSHEEEPECSNINYLDDNMMFEDRGHEDKHAADEECTTAQTVVSEMTSIDNIMLKPSPNKSQLSVTINVTPQSKDPAASGEHKSDVVALHTPAQTVVSEMTSVDNIMLKPSPNKSQLSVTINVTPQSKAPAASGEHKSDVVALHTPAPREHVRAPRKRKCVYDDSIVVAKKVYKEWVEDASDLVRKRRAPSALLAWKQRRSFDYFAEPIIPINADFPSDSTSIISKKELIREKEVVETIEQAPQIDKLGPHDVPEEIYEGIATIETTGERDEVIAPSTPVSQSQPTSVRFNDIPETSMANLVRPTSSSESQEKQLFRPRDFELDETHLEEGQSSVGDDDQDNEKWSAMTRNVGGLLYKNFAQKKGGQDEALNLSHILKKKTRKQSAKFFYQILVLKSGGYVDVKQERPYAEIWLYNEIWMIPMKDSGQLHVPVLPRSFSDHCPIHLKVGLLNFGPKPFRIFNKWIGSADFFEVISTSWEANSRAHSPDIQFKNSLKILRQDIKRWASKKLEEQQGLKDELLKNLEDWDAKAEAGTLNQFEVEKREEWLMDLSHLEHLHREDVKQKCRL
nr:sister chromatid cohesion 1 protein 2 isoform X1 [Tanacetum cinerariifolium]